MESGFRTRLKEHRARLDWTQERLAEEVGVSRQAISAIESDKQVPSTVLALQLALAFQCRVEDLFSLSDGHSLKVWMDDDENPVGTRVALGRVDHRWAAHRLSTGAEACDAVVRSVDGDAPIVEALRPPDELAGKVLVAGCAPILGSLSQRCGLERNGTGATWIPANSSQSLELLESRAVHVAGLHLVESTTPGGHGAIIRQRFSEQRMSVIHLTKWRQGLVIRRENPLGILGIRDVLREDVTFARREPGAGASKLLCRLLRKHGGGVRRLKGPLAEGHAEVARLIQLGFADVGIAIESESLGDGLEFIPLVEERFDLVLPEYRLDSEPVARFIDQVSSSMFKRDASHVAGYDLSSAGELQTVAGD